MQQLAGKRAIITGAGRGIGKGAATAFVKAGARVLLVDREEETGKAAEAELRALGGDAHFLHFDLMRHDELGQVVDTAVSLFGGLDTLVNIAQAAILAPLAQTSDEVMRLPMDSGFWPTFLLMRAAYPHLVVAKGSVINFATGAAFDAMPYQGAYVAAKEAIRAISKVAAGEWGPEGVRVNIVCPFAASPGVMQWQKDAPDEYATQMAKISLRRAGDCEQDIGAAVVFLASDAAQYITGQTLMVDGGQTKAF